jgi:sortase A
MRPKVLSKRRLLTVAFLGLGLFVVLLLNFIPKDSIQGSTVSLVENVVSYSDQEQTNQEEVNVGLPARLMIPVIHVDTAVVPVGITSDGEMDVPKDPAEVAWYSFGSRPGESGNAVIAGHYDWMNNKTAVFDSLHKLSKGDKIFIEDENGVATTFVMREMRIYDKDEDASDVFISGDNKVHLNLITCIGVWDEVEKIYPDRLIVFADKE